MATAAKKTPLMTAAEHTGIYQTIAESVVADPMPGTDRGLDRRVQNGAEFLDTHYPGWADKISLARFDLKSGSECVIGQVFGDYDNDVLEEVFAPIGGIHHEIVKDDDGYNFEREVSYEETAHAFNFEDDDYGYREGADLWRRIEDDWRVAIAARQTR